MGIKKTLGFIKPGNFINPGNFEKRFEIFTCFDKLLRGDLLIEDFTKTNLVYVNPVPEQIIREHYKHISKVRIYEPTIQAFLESKEGIVLRVYEGEDIIGRGKRANGNTDPQKAKKGTIRQRFSNDSMDIAWREKRYLNNVMHCSDPENSEREIELWGPYLMGTIFKKFV